MNRKKKTGLIFLFVLLIFLFNGPCLYMSEGVYQGVPKLMIYIGVVWIAVIVLMLLIFSGKDFGKEER